MDAAEYHKRRVNIAFGSLHSAFEQSCIVILIAFVGVYYSEWIMSAWVNQILYALAILGVWYGVTRYQKWMKNHDIKLSDVHHGYDPKSDDL